jgi:hypothetical protein
MGKRSNRFVSLRSLRSNTTLSYPFSASHKRQRLMRIAHESLKLLKAGWCALLFIACFQSHKKMALKIFSAIFTYSAQFTQLNLLKSVE